MIAFVAEQSPAPGATNAPYVAEALAGDGQGWVGKRSSTAACTRERRAGVVSEAA